MAFAATAMAADPVITSWGNNRTTGDAISVYEFEVIRFNATANQSIDTWHWSMDGADNPSSDDYFETSWDTNGSYSVTVYAANGNGTSNTVPWTITVSDNPPPAQVKNLKNDTVTATTVELLWDTNTESDLVGYDIYYQNGSHIYRISDTTNHYTVQDLSPSTTYVFNVSAYDSSGHKGDKSDGWSVTTAAAGSSGTLTITEVKNTTTSSSATITWTTNNDSNSLVKYGVEKGDYTKKEHDETNEDETDGSEDDSASDEYPVILILFILIVVVLAIILFSLFWTKKQNH